LSRDTHFHAVTHGTHIFGFALARRSCCNCNRRHLSNCQQERQQLQCRV